MPISPIFSGGATVVADQLFNTSSNNAAPGAMFSCAPFALGAGELALFDLWIGAGDFTLALGDYTFLVNNVNIGGLFTIGLASPLGARVQAAIRGVTSATAFAGWGMQTNGNYASQSTPQMDIDQDATAYGAGSPYTMTLAGPAQAGPRRFWGSLTIYTP